jgi:hypothetical protein
MIPGHHGTPVHDIQCMCITYEQYCQMYMRARRVPTNCNTLVAAETLIDAVVDIGLELALPSKTPMHQHNVTKQWTRLDQVFLTDHSMDLLTSCTVQTHHRGINIDHLPIITELELTIMEAPKTALRNFRDVDWDKFRSALEKCLATTGLPTWIKT